MNEQFKAVLDQTLTWPNDFPFKFIVHSELKENFLSKFPELLVHKEVASANGKYVSLTFHLRVTCSQEVVEIYERARGVEGVIAL